MELKIFIKYNSEFKFKFNLWPIYIYNHLRYKLKNIRMNEKLKIIYLLIIKLNYELYIILNL